MRKLDTELMEMADRKQKVVGLYHGQEFEGTVTSSRQITTRPYREEVTIETEPFEVYGEIRTSILVSADQIENGIVELYKPEPPRMAYGFLA